MKKKYTQSEVLNMIKILNTAPLSKSDKAYFNKVKKTVMEMLKRDVLVTDGQTNYLNLMYDRYKDIIYQRETYDYTLITGTVIALNPCDPYKLNTVYKVTIDVREIKKQIEVILPTVEAKKLKLLQKYSFKKNGAEKLVYSVTPTKLN